MLTEFNDDKLGPTYAPNQPIWTLDRQAGKRVEGTVLEVGDESILIQWEDLKDPSEYEIQKVELIGDQFYEDKRECAQLVLPRNEFLLIHVKEIEKRIIEWYKKNHYLQGSGYSVSVTEKGKWAVNYTKDYLMQHGVRQEYILSDEEFQQATHTPPHRGR